MSSVMELVKYRVLAPLLCLLIWPRLYKTQEIRSNEIRLYNWRVRYFGAGST